MRTSLDDRHKELKKIENKVYAEKRKYETHF